MICASSEPYRIQAEAFGELINTRATTVGGLVALAAYLPGAVRGTDRDLEAE
ncbi:hypothetical protein MKK84_04445 [Methylobacterium sp. E-065]|uniref:hypothetical protein n=1 Tax=Methylobacterium sp. E-065 TaxID=2836583 RepID=UPI001FBA91F7|nr:hypothetical protein [Methylobacterium sp. E-065]MCJ2016681.1 hypothetical protein [Methylobacterium sp. E-065]